MRAYRAADVSAPWRARCSSRFNGRHGLARRRLAAPACWKRQQTTDRPRSPADRHRSFLFCGSPSWRGWPSWSPKARSGRGRGRGRPGRVGPAARVRHVRPPLTTKHRYAVDKATNRVYHLGGWGSAPVTRGRQARRRWSVAPGSSSSRLIPTAMEPRAGGPTRRRPREFTLGRRRSTALRRLPDVLRLRPSRSRSCGRRADVGGRLRPGAGTSIDRGGHRMAGSLAVGRAGK